VAVAQARLLGAAGRGDLARFANAGALIVLYCGLGVSAAITYYVASGVAQPATLLRSLRGLFVGTVLGAFAACVVMGVSAFEQLLPSSLSTLATISLLMLFFGFSQLGSWLSAVLAARGDFGAINRISVGVAAAAAIVSVLLLWSAEGWISAAIIIGVVVLLEAGRTLWLALAVRPHLESDKNTAQPEVRPLDSIAVRDVWRYAALAYVGDALLFVTYRFDMWVVDANHGPAVLGQYALAVSLAQLVWIVPTATGRVLFPFSAMLQESHGAAYARRSALLALLVSAGAGLAGWIAAVIAVPSLFGSDFAEVPGLIGILLLGIVPFSVAKVLGNHLAGVNALGVNVAVSVIALAIAVVLDLAWIPSLGAYGAAAATAVSYSVFTLLLVVAFIRRTTKRRAADWMSDATSG
jgi:O-antigen/teichoic acid export membrane protein